MKSPRTGLPMKALVLDMLEPVEIRQIISHFATTSADFYAGVWGGLEMYVSRKNFTAWMKAKGKELTVPTQRKKILGGQVEVAPPKAAPNCRDHKETRMRYNASDGVFICPEPQCKVTAKPRTKKEDFNNTVITGDFELVKTPGDKFYLHITGMDVMIDINSCIEMTGTGQVHGTEKDWTVMCRFPDVRDLDEEVD